jgi:hypothetical protein
MKRTNNNGVASCWVAGVEARNGRGTLWTDGKEVYSYQLCIGFTTEKGTKIVVEHAGTIGFVSMTTSRHVGLTSWVAAYTIHPDFQDFYEKTK